MRRVLVTARSFGQGSDEPLRILEAAGCEVVRSRVDRPLTSQELAEEIPGFDALIAGNDRVDAAAIAAGDSLKVISRYGVGYDNIDLDAAAARGIVVTNTPGANDDSVAELAVALLLSLARRTPLIDRWVKGGTWKRSLGDEVYGKTLGVVGLGSIGRKVALRLRGFEMRVLCYDVAQDVEWAAQHGAEYVELPALLAQADFLSVHVPLSPATRGLIGEAELALMKPTACVINTARGGVIDEAALYRVLKEGRLAGAGLDVLELEPPGDSPLIGLDNVIVTAHSGAYTRDAVRKMGAMSARNVVGVLSGTGSPQLVPGFAELLARAASGV